MLVCALTVAAGGTVTGGLGLSWTALASTATVNAQTNTGIFATSIDTVHLFNPLGQLVAISGADLWDGLFSNSIMYDQNGQPTPPTPIGLPAPACGFGNNRCTWTGTTANGATELPLGSGVVRFGESQQVTINWAQFGAVGGTGLLGLYGVSSEAIVPAAGVPEPTTLTLMAVGLAGLGFRRRRN